MIPVCDTAIEEDKVEAIISRVIVFLSFIPRDFTCFESKFNMLILLCCEKSKITQGIPEKKTILKCSHDASEKPPNSQLNIGLISGFCVININVVNEQARILKEAVLDILQEINPDLISTFVNRLEYKMKDIDLNYENQRGNIIDVD